MSVTLIMFFGVKTVKAGLEATRSGDSNDVLSVEKKKKLFYAICGWSCALLSHGGLCSVVVSSFFILLCHKAYTVISAKCPLLDTNRYY